MDRLNDLSELECIKKFKLKVNTFLNQKEEIKVDILLDEIR